MIAQPATTIALNRKSFRDILDGNQFGLDQQIPQTHACFDCGLPGYRSDCGNCLLVDDYT